MNPRVSKIIDTLNLSNLTEEKSSSIKMILKKLFQANRNDAEELVLFLCNKDVFYSYGILQGLGVKELFDFLKKYINDNIGDLLEQNPLNTVNTVILLEDFTEKSIVIEYIERNIKRYYWGNRENAILLLLHRFMLENADSVLIPKLDELFSLYFSIYNEDYKNEAIRVIDIAETIYIDATVNKIIKIIGLNGLIDIVGVEKAISLLRTQIIMGTADVDVWHQYIDYYFDAEINDEDRLVNLTWFIPMYAEKHQDAYLYAIWKNYEEEKVNPYYSDVWDIPNNPQSISDETREFVRGIMNQEIDSGIDSLVKLLKSKPNISPFWWDNEAYANEIANPQNNQVHMHSEWVLPSFHKIVAMFQKGVDIEDITRLYFVTFLHEEVSIEDLISLVNEYKLSDSFLHAISERLFWGVLKTRKATTLEIVPLNYRSINRQKAFIKEDSSLMRADYNLCVQYRFETIFRQTAVVTIVGDDYENSYETNTAEKWEESLKLIGSLLGDEHFHDSLNQQKERLESLSNFGIERFESELDFGKFIHIIINSTQLSAVNRVLENLLWNSKYAASTDYINTSAYQYMRKYEYQTEKLFQQYLSRARIVDDIEKKERIYEQTLRLYFCSVFKTILPFERIIEMANDDFFDQLLTQRKYLCKPWKAIGESKYLCRLNNCKCGPIAIFNGEGKNFSDARSISGLLIRIIKNDMGKISKLEFEAEDKGHLATIAEIRHVFGVVSRRTGLWKGKRVPDANSFINEYPDEIIGDYCKALYIRRTDEYKMRQLIWKLYVGNPFKYNELGEKAIYYYSLQNNPMSQVTLQSLILNAANVRDLLYIFFNTHLKLLCGVDELMERVSQKNTMNLTGVEEEIKNYRMVGVVRDRKLYSIVLSKTYNVEEEDGIYKFNLNYVSGSKIQLESRIDSIMPQHILMAMYVLHKHGVEKDQYCIDYLKNHNLHLYGDFCTHFDLKNENKSIHSLFEAYADESDLDEALTKMCLRLLNKDEQNSGSYISKFAEQCEDIEREFGKEQALEFMEDRISHIIKNGFFDKINEYALIMQAAQICRKHKWKEEAITYLLRAKTYKDDGIVSSNKSERYLKNIYGEV